MVQIPLPLCFPFRVFVRHLQILRCECGARLIKRVRKIVIFLVVVACTVLAYRALHPRQVSGLVESPQTTATQCDQSLWEHVYNPSRLQILEPCISVTGTVDAVRKESDGDVHILFRLDQEFESLLNEKNILRQHGDLVLEPICQGEIRQADAAEPCGRYNGPYFEPEVGQRYQVWGAYVHDADHGWNELHPVSSMQTIQ